MNVSNKILAAARTAAAYAPEHADRVLQAELAARGLRPELWRNEVQAALVVARAEVERTRAPRPSTQMGRTWVY